MISYLFSRLRCNGYLLNFWFIVLVHLRFIKAVRSLSYHSLLCNKIPKVTVCTKFRKFKLTSSARPKSQAIGRTC